MTHAPRPPREFHRKTWETPMMPRSLTLLPLLLITACATEKVPISPQPTSKSLSGEQMLRESQGMAQLAQRFKEGEALVHQGEQLVEKGNQQIVEGKRLISEGKRITEEAEKGYGDIKH